MRPQNGNVVTRSCESLHVPSPGIKALVNMNVEDLADTRIVVS